MAQVHYCIGDVVRMQKRHPCGSFEWEITRVGMDFRIRCLKCGRQVMMPRPKFEKEVKEVVRQAIPNVGHPTVNTQQVTSGHVSSEVSVSQLSDDYRSILSPFLKLNSPEELHKPNKHEISSVIEHQSVDAIGGLKSIGKELDSKDKEKVKPHQEYVKNEEDNYIVIISNNSIMLNGS